jgi:DNA-binding PadR family transcriptional regulator
MYELMILSILIRWSTHGYRIAKIINDMIGPYAKMSNGRLYPLLSQLEAQGMIKAVEEMGEGAKGGRKQQTYQITDEGRVRYHDLMMDTTSNPGEYRQIFLQKVPTLRFLKPAERLYLIDHYINYCQAHILHQMAEREDIQARSERIDPVHVKAVVQVMQHMIDQWQLELDWTMSLRQQELAQAEGIEEKGVNPYATPGSGNRSQRPV